MNGAASGVIAVETILGDGPTLKGNKADLVARLGELADADGKLLGHSTDARTNTVADGGKISAETSGTPAAGIGTALLFQAKSQDEAPSDILRLGGVFDDVGTASEDSRFVVWLRVAGAALARVYEWAATTGFKAIFTHSNSADRTYILPNESTTLVGTTDTAVLTNKTLQASAGASMVLIETLDLSSDNVVNSLGSTYDEHIFQLIGVKPGTNAVNLLVTISIDNGSTFASSSYSTSKFGVQLTAQSSWSMATGQVNTANNPGVNGYIRLFNPQSTTTGKAVTWQLVCYDSVATYDETGAGHCFDTSPNVITSAVNAVKFAFSSGTISGTLRHYGIKNS